MNQRKIPLHDGSVCNLSNTIEECRVIGTKSMQRMIGCLSDRYIYIYIYTHIYTRSIRVGCLALFFLTLYLFRSGAL
jgi:hypothetical protein